MAPRSTSHKKRKAALQRHEAAAAATTMAVAGQSTSGAGPAVSGCPTGQSRTPSGHHSEDLGGFTLTPMLEDTIPLVENNDATTASERPPALSIRCKKTKLPDMVDMATGNATTAQRGVVVGTKTEYLVRMNNNKRLKVEYSTRHRRSATREFKSLMSRDIGSIIRSKVPMLAPSFLSLSDVQRDVVNTGIETNYDIPATDVEMWNFIDATAQTIYKDWKHDCHQHYLHVSQETPAEFLGREEEWEWLKCHFEDSAYLKLYERNRGNRNKNKEQQINHHSRPLALSYRSEVLEKKGHKASTVQTWIDVYQPDKNATEKVATVKRKLNEVLSQQDSTSGDNNGDVVSRDHHIPLDTQINSIEEDVGSRPGPSMRGVGRAVTRDPKPRGEARVTDNVEESQSLKREARKSREEARKYREEARKYREETRKSREVTRKSREVTRKFREDYNALAQKMQQMEALMRSIQAGSQQAPVPPPAPGMQSSCNAVPDHESTL